MNEDELEKVCLEWFRDNSWDVLYGTYISSDSNNLQRSDIHGVVLKRHLHEAFVRINPYMH